MKPNEAVDNLEGLSENKSMKSLEECLEEAFAPFKKQLGSCLLQNIRKEGEDDKQDNFEKNAETNKDNENTVNIEEAQIWAVNQ